MGFQPHVYRACLPLVRARVSGEVERLELHTRTGDATRDPAARAAPSANHGLMCALRQARRGTRHGLPVGGAVLTWLRVPAEVLLAYALSLQR
jgi:hypothetical protein